MVGKVLVFVLIVATSVQCYVDLKGEDFKLAEIQNSTYFAEYLMCKVRARGYVLEASAKFLDKLTHVLEDMFQLSKDGFSFASGKLGHIQDENNKQAKHLIEATGSRMNTTANILLAELEDLKVQAENSKTENCYNGTEDQIRNILEDAKAEMADCVNKMITDEKTKTQNAIRQLKAIWRKIIETRDMDFEDCKSDSERAPLECYFRMAKRMSYRLLDLSKEVNNLVETEAIKNMKPFKVCTNSEELHRDGIAVLNKVLKCIGSNPPVSHTVKKEKP